MTNLFQFYQKIISPISHTLGHTLFGPGYACRFQPTCSQYAREAFQKHSFLPALYLSCYRILRCHPYSVGGYDPVPDKIKSL